tara:strand:+ start:639 stop:2669 length:2031 start_codon:yes stop_codon:yes gene_type:complete
MPYSDKEHIASNIDYLNKDFDSFKSTLVEYTKTYFPNTYRDFNETSPGMMLIEMSAYVGDVLSYYIDKQYKEMMLPLAEERKNVINVANMLGYKVKPTSPSYVTLKVTQNVDADTTDINNIKPTFSDATTLSNRTEVQSTIDSSIIFQTLDVVDFTVSSSSDVDPVESTFDSNGVVDTFDIIRKVNAISAETKTKTFNVGSPTKFLTLDLDETNVIDIISVTDSKQNTYYEVDYLAQEYVPIETHYGDDDPINGRTTAYSIVDTETESTIPVPYTLQYIRTTKRFTTKINEDNTTSLVFGNGILRSGQIPQSEFLQTEQAGIVIPGEINPFNQAVDPLVSDNKSTLGETPANTTITVTYRVGGGVDANITSADLTTLVNPPGGVTISVTNDEPARGGSSGETIEEIRNRAASYYASQNRCVTQEDYEARVLAMPAKFGNIAKVFVNRGDDLTTATIEDTPSTINIYMLSYDNNKNLVTAENPSDIVSHPLKNNLSNYLDQYRLMSDTINITDGYIVNFGVMFDVVAHKTSNKNDVKLRCINLIRDYFNIDKMQFSQAIYTSDLEYELMGLDGVRSVSYVELTQDFSNLVNGTIDTTGLNELYTYSIVNNEVVTNENSSGYGYKYDFHKFYGDITVTNGSTETTVSSVRTDGIILPSSTPSVFELKNPNQNIKGIVR